MNEQKITAAERRGNLSRRPMAKIVWIALLVVFPLSVIYYVYSTGFVLLIEATPAGFLVFSPLLLLWPMFRLDRWLMYLYWFATASFFFVLFNLTSFYDGNGGLGAPMRDYVLPAIIVTGITFWYSWLQQVVNPFWRRRGFRIISFAYWIAFALSIFPVALSGPSLFLQSIEDESIWYGFPFSTSTYWGAFLNVGIYTVLVTIGYMILLSNRERMKLSENNATGS